MTETTEIKEFLTVKEVAAELGVSPGTVYKYVKDGKITPFNINDWHIEQHFKFTKEEVEKVKGTLEKKDGLTTTDVAEKLGCTTVTVLRYIKEGKIEATKKLYKGLERHFISEEEFEKIKVIYEKETKTYYLKEHETYLCQSFVQEGTRKIARIIHLDEKGNGTAVTEDEATLTLKELKQSFDASTKMVTKPNNPKKGYAKFVFPKPKQVRSFIYDFIEQIQEQVGINNIRLDLNGDKVILEVKPSLITLVESQYQDYIDLINNHLVEGKFSTRKNQVYVDSDIEVIQTYVPTKLKNTIKRAAKERGLTIDELVQKELAKLFSE